MNIAIQREFRDFDQGLQGLALEARERQQAAPPA
jgi:hypothetical protein